MEVKNRRKRQAWWWTAGLFAMMSLSGCSMYPSKPGAWPTNWWGQILHYVSDVIDWTAAHITGGSYGLALLLVTVVVRLIIMPLFVKQIRYQKVMQQMQPEMQKIRQKYKGDNQKIQEETMKMYKTYGVNPMAGCFPMVVQLPMLYALYGAIEGNVKLNQSTFLHIFQLGQHDHTYILPLLAAITTYFSSRLMMAGVEGQQKMMLYVMPVFIFIIGARFPAGLALYWIYTNLFQTVQTYFVKVRPAGNAEAAAAGAPARTALGGKGKASSKQISSGKAQKPNPSKKEISEKTDGSGPEDVTTTNIEQATSGAESDKPKGQSSTSRKKPKQ